MTDDKDFLGKEPIGRLLMKLALPTVTAQVINLSLIHISVQQWDARRRRFAVRSPPEA